MIGNPRLSFLRPLHERLLASASTLVRVFIVLVLLGWISSAENLRSVSRQQPDNVHTFLLQHRGSAFYIRPVLGKVYVNFPWLLGGSLAFAVLMDYLQKKQLRKRT